MRRTEFLAASGAALLAAPTVASAQSLTKLRVALTADQDVLGILYGQQAGLFRKAGLDLEMTRMNGSPEITAALVGGSLDSGR